MYQVNIVTHEDEFKAFSMGVNLNNRRLDSLEFSDEINKYWNIKKEELN